MVGVRNNNRGAMPKKVMTAPSSSTATTFSKAAQKIANERAADNLDAFKRANTPLDDPEYLQELERKRRERLSGGGGAASSGPRKLGGGGDVESSFIAMNVRAEDKSAFNKGALAQMALSESAAANAAESSTSNRTATEATNMTAGEKTAQRNQEMLQKRMSGLDDFTVMSQRVAKSISSAINNFIEKAIALLASAKLRKTDEEIAEEEIKDTADNDSEESEGLSLQDLFPVFAAGKSKDESKAKSNIIGFLKKSADRVVNKLFYH